MRYGLVAVVLIGAATLCGCTEGVLDPKGPIAFADRQILLNALGIMLAIVVPVIFATHPSGARLPFMIARWPCGYMAFVPGATQT